MTRLGVEADGRRRDEARVHERHRADGEAEDGDAAAVRAEGYLICVDARKLRDGAQDGLLDGAFGLVVKLGRGAEVEREGEHPRVLARAVVAQDARRLAARAQALGRRAVEGLVDAAFEETCVEADLFEQACDRLDVQVFAAVRAAGDCQLRFGQAETFGRAARQERDGLEGLGGGAQVRDGLGLA